MQFQVEQLLRYYLLRVIAYDAALIAQTAENIFQHIKNLSISRSSRCF